MGHYDKDKAAAKRAAFIAQGLTGKGKPRKGRAKPDPQPHQHIRFSKKRKPPVPPKPRAKNETPEQRRERGRMMRSSPLALSLEESIAKRLKAMGRP